MKEKEDDSLMKSRSARSVVAAAFRLLSGNFRRLFRTAWPAALIFAFAKCVIGTIYVGGISNYFLLAIIVVMIVVGGLAELMTYSVGLELLGGHASMGRVPLTVSHFPLPTFWRALKAFLSLALVEVPVILAYLLISASVLGPAIADPGSHKALLAAFSLSVVVCAILELPLAYVAMRYIMNGEVKFWKSFWQSYKAGFAHIGHIIVVIIINAIIVVIAHCIIIQPEVILKIAYAKALGGEALGDPLGMPSYVLWLGSVTFLVCGFLQPFIRMPFVFSLYYMYGAIATAESEKKEFKEISNEENTFYRS